MALAAAVAIAVVATAEVTAWMAAQRAMSSRNPDWRRKDRDGALNLGLGAKFFINERLLIRCELRDSLAQKDELMREIHHRVKNNLQVISSLLNMQQRSLTESFDANVNSLGWSPDSRRIYIVAGAKGRDVLYSIDLSGKGAPTEISVGDCSDLQVRRSSSGDGATLIFSAHGVSRAIHDEAARLGDFALDDPERGKFPCGQPIQRILRDEVFRWRALQRDAAGVGPQGPVGHRRGIRDVDDSPTRTQPEVSLLAGDQPYSGPPTLGQRHRGHRAGAFEIGGRK